MKTPNELQLIDLELPSGTLWANLNIGANSTLECGHYFAWGEVVPKDEYTKQNSLTQGIKGVELISRGIVNTLGILNPEYDAATSNWGKEWIIPTGGQFSELLSNCFRYAKVVDGMPGIIFRSRINQKEIFFPLSGSYRGNTLQYLFTNARYWASETGIGPFNGLNRGACCGDANICIRAKCAYITSFRNTSTFCPVDRYEGNPIRAVYKEKKFQS